MYGPDEILRTVACDRHAIEHESRPQAAAAKFRIDRRQIIVSDSEAIPLLDFQSLSPKPVAGDLAIHFGDKNPVRPACKRRAHPFGIYAAWPRLLAFVDLRGIDRNNWRTLFRLYAKSAGRSAAFAAANLQLSIAFRKTDFFQRSARKIKDEIQQRVHEQKAALFQGMNCGQLAGLDSCRPHILSRDLARVCMSSLVNARRISAPAGSSLVTARCFTVPIRRPMMRLSHGESL